MALPNTEILVGAPPLLWSNVHEAFEKINQNFISLDLATGGSAVNLETLSSNVSPAVTNDFALGSDASRWKSVFVGEYDNTVQGEGNGVWLGSAQIRGVTGYIDLPVGSRVDGNLIIDPEKTFFKEIQVDNNLSVVATQFADSFNLLSGSGIAMSVNSINASIEVSNTGILNVLASSGIAVSTVSGATTITNTGVRSLTSTTALPGGRAAGSGINISGSTGDAIRVTNTGVINITSGVGITVSLDSGSGEVQITNSAPAQPAFQRVEINGDTANQLVAQGTAGIFRIESGPGITLAKNTSTRTITVTVDPVFDLKGSIFGDDSTKIVDAVENKVFGGIFATTLRTEETKIALGSNAGNTNQGANGVAIGWVAGSLNQGNSAVAVGVSAGNIAQGSNSVAMGPNAGNDLQGNNAIAIGSAAGFDTQGNAAISIGNSAGYDGQGSSAIAIGSNAGATNQGNLSIAIGSNAGNLDQPQNSIIISATGGVLNAATNGLFIAPIRSTANGTPLMYNSTTNELSYSTVLEFVGSRISTSDSSGLTIDVQTTFNTDVIVENDLDVTQRLRVQGSRIINLIELQSVVAVSIDFADFQTRIAALV